VERRVCASANLGNATLQMSRYYQFPLFLFNYPNTLSVSVSVVVEAEGRYTSSGHSARPKVYDDALIAVSARRVFGHSRFFVLRIVIWQSKTVVVSFGVSDAKRRSFCHSPVKEVT
jgi:hypothetical protein